MKIEAFSQEDKDYHTACIYGPSGAGKTTLAASFPKPILFLDFDGKMGTIPPDRRDSLFRADFVFDDVLKAPAKFEDFRNTWRKIKKQSYTLPNGEKPATVVLDSATMLDILNIYYFMDLNGKNLETEKPTLPIYGDQSNFYNSFFAGINSFSCNVIVIFHEFYNTDDTGITTGIQPLITGSKMLNKIPAIFQETWYLKIVKDKRTLFYQPYKNAVANSIWLKGEGSIVDPTYEKIVEESKKKQK